MPIIKNPNHQRREPHNVLHLQYIVWLQYPNHSTVLTISKP